METRRKILTLTNTNKAHQQHMTKQIITKRDIVIRDKKFTMRIVDKIIQLECAKDETRKTHHIIMAHHHQKHTLWIIQIKTDYCSMHKNSTPFLKFDIIANIR